MKDPLIWFHLLPSKLLCLGFAILHAGGLLCVWAAQLPLWLSLPSAAAVLFSGYDAIVRHALRCHPQSVVELRIDQSTGVWCQLRSGDQVEQQLCQDSYTSPVFSVLKFHGRGCKLRPVFIVAGLVDSDTLRRIRVLLRTHDWHAGA